MNLLICMSIQNSQLMLFTLFASHCASLQPSRYRPINREAFDISYRISALLFYKTGFFSPCHVAVLQSHCMKSSLSERIAFQAGRRKRSMHTITSSRGSSVIFRRRRYCLQRTWMSLLPAKAITRSKLSSSYAVPRFCRVSKIACWSAQPSKSKMLDR